MRNIVRQPVTRQDFFVSQKLIKKVRKAMDAKLPISITGPPKSGKTSLLYYLRDNMQNDFYFVYYDAGLDEHEIDFIKGIEKVFADLMNLPTFDTPSFNGLTNSLARYTNNHTPLVIMVDNFSTFLENIYKNHGLERMVNFLNENRAFRSLTGSKLQNVMLIYTSSIDLDYIASTFDALQTVNDLYHIEIPPLTREEALDFTMSLLDNVDCEMNPPALASNITDRLQWFNPNHIQMLIYELGIIQLEKELAEITGATITDAMTAVLNHTDYYEQCRSHLQAFLSEKEYEITQHILTQLMLQPHSRTSQSELDALGATNKAPEQYAQIMKTLIQRQYIRQDNVNHVYRFTSPLFENWWKERTCLNISPDSKSPQKQQNTFSKIKIKRIRIQHIKCFEDVEINFDTSVNTSLIIGTNGKGKSTILQLIALGLNSVVNVPFIHNWKKVVKKGHSKGYFEMDMLIDKKKLQLTFEIDAKKDSITYKKGSNKLQSTRDNFMLLAYGVNRSIKLEERLPETYKSQFHLCICVEIFRYPKNTDKQGTEGSKRRG